MPSESTLYCFRRKIDAEKLSEQIKESSGKLGYCTVILFGGTYSIKCGDIWHKRHVSYADALSYILRKWW